MSLREAAYRARRVLFPVDFPLWYSPAYRLPITGTGIRGIEPRRADYVAWWLLQWRAVRPGSLRAPPRVEWEALARVHDAALLESLGHAETLARIFATDPSDIPVDELMHTVRLACGATVAAARETLRSRDPHLNLLGGFHHAAPGAAGGFCPVNDIAVAVAAVRAEGFQGRVAVLDLDAHPPDGLARCFAGDPSVFVGSLSGSDWGPLPGVDETLLPEGTGDAAYLEALEALLGRMPAPELCFVIAGSDVLAGDRLGRLGLSLAGVRRRDRRVAVALDGLPSVWLPGGGYTPDAWKALAGTGMVLGRGSLTPVPRGYDPMMARYSRIARRLSPELLGESELSRADIEEALGLAGGDGPRLLLGFYTAQGLEYSLHRYGILEPVRRLGYANFRVVVDRAGLGDRMRLLGDADGREHLLVELVAAKAQLAGHEVLFVHWLSLRNPRAQFTAQRPQLPGQEVPGLGMAREWGQLLARMAKRLGLSGVAFRPAHFHTAYAARHELAFVDPVRQGRFEALLRDTASFPLLEVIRALEEGRILLDDAPYAWEPGEMALWVIEPPDDPAAREAERARARFHMIG
jgi:acetoin utilization deacetylase AcuC-like enzyme